MGDASIACGDTDNPLIVPELWVGWGGVGWGGEGKGGVFITYLNE
jgi:hypothetical protein